MKRNYRGFTFIQIMPRPSTYWSEFILDLDRSKKIGPDQIFLVMSLKLMPYACIALIMWTGPKTSWTRVKKQKSEVKSNFWSGPTFFDQTKIFWSLSKSVLDL